MKRNLIKGIVLISAVALSSCSSTQLAGVKNTAYNDDVYYTRAKAGDKIDDIALANQQNNYKGDDDYYYYGDYVSRLNRFSNYSPFDYGDNFYFSYVPYNNGFGDGLSYDRDYYASYYGFNNTTNANPYINNGSIYSPYDYGYSPYYDMGYDDYGYGDVYSAYIIGGGGGGYSYGGAKLWKHNNTNSLTANSNPNARSVRVTPSPGITRISSLPGRPSVSVNTTTGIVTRNTTGMNGNNNNNFASRETRESYRPQQQQQSVAPQPSSVNTSSSSAGSSTSSTTSSGGGGRPVRP